MSEPKKKKKVSKLFYMGLNLIAPGIGQFALGWFVRGFLQLLLALTFFIWGCWEAIYPVVSSIIAMWKDGDGDIDSISVVKLIMVFLFLILIWIWSFLDIVLFYKEPEEA